MKILIIEDDLALFNLYKTQLELNSYEVVHVSEGNLAVDKVKEEAPDLVLLDIMLPGRNGLEILQDIREQEETQDVKVIMLTNFGNEENVSAALELGAVDYIMKYKIVPSELVDKISSVLGGSGASGVSVQS